MAAALYANIELAQRPQVSRTPLSLAACDGGRCRSNFCIAAVCRRGFLPSGRRAGLSYGLDSYAVGGMALGFPSDAGGWTDPRSGLISHLDSLCFVRNASNCSRRRARDSTSRSRSGAPVL